MTTPTHVEFLDTKKHLVLIDTVLYVKSRRHVKSDGEITASKDKRKQYMRNRRRLAKDARFEAAMMMQQQEQASQAQDEQSVLVPESVSSPDSSHI